ncbi:hypothetical protein BDZ97DRAFT_1841573, partial [Flammula alnicola]
APSDDELMKGETDAEEITINSGDGKPERWRASEPPEESFDGAEGADDNGEWRFQIIGEEVDYKGDLLYVRWDDWHRADGTKTTWNTVNSIESSYWHSTQQKARRQIANDSMEIDVITTSDIHNTATSLRSQAYEEKLEQLARAENRRRLPNLVADMAKLMANIKNIYIPLAQPLYPPTNQCTTADENSLASSSSSLARSSSKTSAKSSATSNSGTVASSTSASSADPLPITPTTSKGKGKQRAITVPEANSTIISKPSRLVSPLVNPANSERIIRSESTDELSALPSSSSTPARIGPPRKIQRTTSDAESPAIRRTKLQYNWTRSTEKAGAAPILFVNDVDDEAIRHLMLLLSTLNLLTYSGNCGCQDDWGLPGLHILPIVPKGMEVIECNKLCSCSLYECNNRVSQRPRDVPIEIFKTLRRGWGVRSTIDIIRGKVLGIYTGRREADPASEYCFDLDNDEAEDNESRPRHGKFSVDSKREGNWTRFLNHSCSPNLEVYLVVHDKPPGTGMPYIAFVATEDIPARTEFTFDYDPKVGKEIALAKSKWKKKGKPPIIIPEGSRLCFCESRECRGYLS